METIKLPVMRCVLCGYKWFPKFNRKPVKCARCHSPNWEKGSKKAQAEKRSKKVA